MVSKSEFPLDDIASYFRKAILDEYDQYYWEGENAFESESEHIRDEYGEDEYEKFLKFVDNSDFYPYVGPKPDEAESEASSYAKQLAEDYASYVIAEGGPVDYDEVMHTEDLDEFFSSEFDFGSATQFDLWWYSGSPSGRGYSPDEVLELSDQWHQEQ